MAEVKWIKIPYNFFDLKEVKALKKYKNKDELLVILIHLIVIANKKTPRNVFKISNNIELTDDIMSNVLRIKKDKWIKAKCIYIKQNLIEISPNAIYIKDFWKSSRDRNSKDYIKWRTKVFERDKYTCRKCGQVGGMLNAHHITRWVDSPKLRYVVDNGITLCEKCHKLEHKKGGV